MLTTKQPLTSEEFKSLYRPQYPYASDNLQEGIYRTSRDTAFSKRFIQTTARTPNLMVLDFDVPDADRFVQSLIYDTESLPTPNYLTINPATTHGQVGFFIDGFLGTEKGQGWFRDISRKLTLAVGSDPAYTNGIMRNPLHPHQQTIWGTANPYTLKELSSYTENLNQSHNAVSAVRPVTEGRNNWLFDELRQYAYRVKQKHQRADSFVEDLTAYANTLNTLIPQPLPAVEVKSITKSVSKWVWKKMNLNPEQFLALQKTRSLKAVEVRQLKASDRYETALLLNQTHSIQEVAELMGLTYNAAKKLLQRARKHQA